MIMGTVLFSTDKAAIVMRYGKSGRTLAQRFKIQTPETTKPLISFEIRGSVY
jgi:hypothetical protein